MDGAWLLQYEAQLRLACFLFALVLLLAAQHFLPKREVQGGWQRVLTNFSLVAVDTVFLRLLFPLLAVGLALKLQESGTGLLHGLPQIPAVALGLIVLDLAIYGQHRLMHRIPLLWRLHRVHHCDTSLDVSSGVRFHPLEIIVSMAIKLGVIYLLGITPLAVLAFEILLNLGSLFTHSNLALPAGLDRTLRWLLVTPDMHRVHHSVYRIETDSNYGFHLSLWDRLFGSYRLAPKDGHQAMRIGLPEFREAQEQKLSALLLNPFRD